MSYKQQLKEMVWSHSRINSFDNCPYEFYLHYLLDNDSIYPPDNNYYAEVGSFVHLILEKIFKKEIGIDEACQFFVDEYDNYITYEVKPSIMDKTFDKVITFFSESDFTWIDDYEILGVEQKIEFKIGSIDLLLRDKQDGKMVIVDHKSMSNPFGKKGKIKKNSEHNFLTYIKQAYLYAYGVYQLYNEYPKEFMWYLFKDEGKRPTIKFELSNCENTIQNILSSIHKIEQERDFEPNLNYFYCNNLCNYRNCCEYKYDKDEEGW